MDVRKLDAVQQLAWDSEYPCAVIGRGTEFWFAPIDELPLLPQTVQIVQMRGLAFVGVMGVLNGLHTARCEPFPEAVLPMMLAAGEYAQFLTRLKEKIAARPKDAATDWLQELWALEDTREN